MSKELIQHWKVCPYCREGVADLEGHLERSFNVVPSGKLMKMQTRGPDSGKWFNIEDKHDPHVPTKAL